MALINSWVIYKAVCKSNISQRAYIQKLSKELIGSLNGATELLNFERTTRSSRVSSATRKLKIRKCDTLVQKTAACVLVNRAEIEKLTSVQCVEAQ